MFSVLKKKMFMLLLLLLLSMLIVKLLSNEIESFCVEYVFPKNNFLFSFSSEKNVSLN